MKKEDFRMLIEMIDEVQNTILTLIKSPSTKAKDKVRLKKIDARLDFIADIIFEYEPLR